MASYDPFESDYEPRRPNRQKKGGSSALSILLIVVMLVIVAVLIFVLVRLSGDEKEPNTGSSVAPVTSAQGDISAPAPTPSPESELPGGDESGIVTSTSPAPTPDPASSAPSPVESEITPTPGTKVVGKQGSFTSQNEGSLKLIAEYAEVEQNGVRKLRVQTYLQFYALELGERNGTVTVAGATASFRSPRFLPSNGLQKILIGENFFEIPESDTFDCAVRFNARVNYSGIYYEDLTAEAQIALK